MNPILGLYRLAGACPDNTVLTLEEGAREGLVRGGLSLFSHVFTSRLTFDLSLGFWELPTHIFSDDLL